MRDIKENKKLNYNDMFRMKGTIKAEFEWEGQGKALLFVRRLEQQVGFQ